MRTFVVVLEQKRPVAGVSDWLGSRRLDDMFFLLGLYGSLVRHPDYMRNRHEASQESRL